MKAWKRKVPLQSNDRRIHCVLQEKLGGVYAELELTDLQTEQEAVSHAMTIFSHEVTRVLKAG